MFARFLFRKLCRASRNAVYVRVLSFDDISRLLFCGQAWNSPWPNFQTYQVQVRCAIAACESTNLILRCIFLLFLEITRLCKFLKTFPSSCKTVHINDRCTTLLLFKITMDHCLTGLRLLGRKRTKIPLKYLINLFRLVLFKNL